MVRVIHHLGRTGFWSILLLAAISSIFFNGIAKCEEVSPEDAAAEALLGQLKEAIKSRDRQEANQLSDQIVQIYPNSIYAMDSRAEVGFLSALKKDDAGVANALTQLFTQHSTQPKVTRAIGRVTQGYISKKNPAKAHAIYSEALTQMPDHPDVVWLHGGIIKCQIIQGDFTQAEAGLEQLTSQYSSAEGFAESLNAVKYAYWLIKDYNKAKTLCNRILTEFPNHPLVPLVFRDKVRAYIHLHNISNADVMADEFFTKYSQTPDFVNNAVLICNSFIAENKPNLALKFINRAIRISPESEKAKAKAVMILGKIANNCVTNNDDMGAANAIGQLCTQYSAQPKVTRAIDRIAQVYITEENVSKARAVYTEAISKMSDHPNVVWLYGGIVKCQIMQGNFIQAEAGLGQLWPQYRSADGVSECLNAIRRTYMKACGPVAYRAMCERIVTAIPDHPFALLVLKNKVKRHIDFQEMEQAEIKTEELFTKYSQSPGFMTKVLSVCNSFVKRNDPVMALQYINRALQALPNHEKAILLLKIKAECYVEMDADDQAAAVYDEIVQYHSTKKEFASVLTGIADSYRKRGNHEKSMELYQQAINNNLDQNEKIRVHAGIAMNSVWLDDNAGAQAKVDLILADYIDHPKAGFSVFVIGEEYYKKAHTADGKSKERANECHRKAISIWQNNINTIQDPFHKCLAYYYSGLSYQSLKKYQNSLVNLQKVVDDYPDSSYAANALFMMGKVHQKTRGKLGFNSATISMSISDPNEPMGSVASLELSEISNLNSVTAMPVEAVSMTINSTRAAFELLVEKYPNSPGASYASRWLTNNSSN